MHTLHTPVETNTKQHSFSKETEVRPELSISPEKGYLKTNRLQMY